MEPGPACCGAATGGRLCRAEVQATHTRARAHTRHGDAENTTKQTLMKKTSWKETNLIFLLPFDSFLFCPKGGSQLKSAWETIPLYHQWLGTQDALLFITDYTFFFPCVSGKDKRLQFCYLLN